MYNFQSQSKMIKNKTIWPGLHNIDLLKQSNNQTNWSKETVPLTFYSICIESSKLIKFSYSNRILRLLMKLFGAISFVFFVIRLLVTIHDLYICVIVVGSNIMEEMANRMLTGLLLSIDILTILYTSIVFDATKFCRSFDSIWIEFEFVSDATLIRIIKRGLRRAIFALIFLVLSEILLTSFMFIFYPNFVLYPNTIVFRFSGYSLFYARVVEVYFTFVLQSSSLFVSAGFDYICRKLDQVKVSCPLMFDVDVLFYKTQSVSLPQSISASLDGKQFDAKRLEHYRKMYESLNGLVNETGTTFKYYILTTFATAIPMYVTITYDITFSQMEFKFYHVIHSVSSALNILTLSYYLGRYNKFSAKSWQSIYRLTLINKDDSFQAEASLFLDRVDQHPVGIRIGDFYLISSSFGPSLITFVITLFVSITSLNSSNLLSKSNSFNVTTAR